MISARGGLLAVWLIVLSAQVVGCGASRRPRVRLDPGVHRPEAAALLITVDGLAADQFERFLDAGDLPNIKTHLIDRGVRVRRAVASQPTITYANLTTILTGCYAGRHGILGNKWFDRRSLVYRDYTTIATYRDVGQDFATPTLFDRVAPGRSVSIQCANRRGVSRTIDNWASSGVRWFFGRLTAVDRLVPLRMELIAQDANRWGAWPVLIHAYLPAVDETGHRFGPDSAQYRRAVINVDRQIGRLVQAVDDAGMLERTCFVLTSDHGQVSSAPNLYFDVAKHLRRRGLTVQGKPASRTKRYYAGVDAVVVTGGDRRAVVHLRGRDGWQQPPRYAAVEALLTPPGAGGASFWDHPAVELALAPRRDRHTGAQTIEVYSRAGHSRLSRRRAGDRLEYGCHAVTNDALGGAVPSGWYDAETWLGLTADTPYPDFVVPLVEMFESPRAGDVMLVAAEGWDFVRGNRGGHGGVGAGDMLIPLVFAGPQLPGGTCIAHARLVDVAPTIMGILGHGRQPPDANQFDGVDRSDKLRAANRSSCGG